MSLRHALLGLLSQGPASGYDLLKTFDISLANVWPATQSQVYAELRHWLTETDPGPPSRRSEMLLRVFFLGELSREQARAYLHRQAEIGEEQIGRLTPVREMISTMDDDLSVYGRLALEWGLRFSALRRDWALWAEKEIDRLPGGEGERAEPETGAGPREETDRT
ncbi:PadR family transcriptional regulator [Streptosporangium algeriense]|uniref:PadR family transcriptional regulator n=1 Tax=Streptosporangium algeriense TaxID=1682748 RepID=A0ABW3DS36_9ACTN